MIRGFVEKKEHEGARFGTDELCEGVRAHKLHVAWSQVQPESGD